MFFFKDKVPYFFFERAIKMLRKSGYKLQPPLAMTQPYFIIAFFFSSSSSFFFFYFYLLSISLNTITNYKKNQS